ncbi:glycosyltransferase [Phycicoccus sp. CSK15P-2]|uniref:glycosyltransferase n=1 Tax=Phycicoccus sp. CSK15P-2 TaxID=2807627 RepID=UPI00194F2864|nr:glycosyltransferase [Phycicoccus sp. CSK15P-2]MBM6402945.1 glycosyltransferase [Phycicoccus sp. CSK15P-2]
MTTTPHPLSPPWFASTSGPAVRVLVIGDGSESVRLDLTVARVSLEPVHLDDDPGTTRARVLATTARATLAAGPRPALVRRLIALKRSPALRTALRGADHVLSTDPVTDAALRAVPQVLRGCPWTASGDLDAFRAAHEDLDAWLAAAGTSETEPTRPTGPALEAPGAAFVVVDAVHHASRRDAALAVAVLRAVDDDPWTPTARLGSGLDALRLSLRLRTDEDPAAVPDDDIADVVTGTLQAADAALGGGRAGRALGLVSDALGLAFHRERHSESLRSALIEDPRSVLAPFVASSTVDRLARRRARPGRALEDTAPVLVLTSPYASFHTEVVNALTGAGHEVDTVALHEQYALFTRTVVDPEFLVALAHLSRWDAKSGVGDRSALRTTERRVLEATCRLLTGRRAVFCDWLDRSTVWASHLCPDDVRLTVRVHAVDALSPWLPLVRWAAVDEVVVVSEAMRSLVRDELAVLGHDVPVRVVPSFGDVSGLRLPKADDARTRLGMVGWGRRVKDPLWALDVLETDDAWTLLLIGPPPGSPASASEAVYLEELRRRLADPALAGRVEVLGWTDDVPDALRRVGVVLSTSRREGCHRGLIEGSASGAVAVVRDWPLLASRVGAAGLVPAEWVVRDVAQAAARIREVTAPDRWPEESESTATTAARIFDGRAADAAYVEAVLGERP